MNLKSGLYKAFFKTNRMTIMENWLSASSLLLNSAKVQKYVRNVFLQKRDLGKDKDVTSIYAEKLSRIRKYFGQYSCLRALYFDWECCAIPSYVGTKLSGGFASVVQGALKKEAIERSRRRIQRLSDDRGLRKPSGKFSLSLFIHVVFRFVFLKVRVCSWTFSWLSHTTYNILLTFNMA